jgi:hypothetical protein
MYYNLDLFRIQKFGLNKKISLFYYSIFKRISEIAVFEIVRI